MFRLPYIGDRRYAKIFNFRRFAAAKRLFSGRSPPSWRAGPLNNRFAIIHGGSALEEYTASTNNRFSGAFCAPETTKIKQLAVLA